MVKPAVAKTPKTLERDVFSEYHATGSTTGGFMLRHGDFKYIYYVGYPPQLFNVVEDPREMDDLIDEPAYSDIVKDMDSRLRSVADPEEVDSKAKALQETILDSHGGREKVLHEYKPVVYTAAPTTKEQRDSK